MTITKRKRVMVLGCGPAGLFAAHAATQLGFGVDIFSRKRRSEMFGAQYLHTNIPGLTDDQEPFKVEYKLNGTLDEYLHKVYGAEIPDPGKITVESLLGEYEAWDIRRAYLKAWDLYGRGVVNTGSIRAFDLATLLTGETNWKAIISTIPQPDVCNRPTKHEFLVRYIWALGDAPERGQFVEREFTQYAPDSIIQYDGTAERDWYRVSNIAGYCAVEWPYDEEFGISPFPGAARVVKPIRSDCDCWDDLAEKRGIRFIRIGRYGAWHRTGHTHQAYWRILDALKDL